MTATVYGRTYRGRTAHIMTRDGAATLCGRPLADLSATWPAGLSASQGVAVRPTCSACRTGLAESRRRPVTADEVTEPMLATARADADASCLPQTVWASEHGRQFGTDAALVSAAFISNGPPGAVGQPLVSVLPRTYLTGYDDAADYFRPLVSA